jgi:hypothetical protein
MAAKRKKRRTRARYKIVMEKGGPSVWLMNSRGRVVNAINGGRDNTIDDVRRAAKKWFPDAREVK